MPTDPGLRKTMKTVSLLLSILAPVLFIGYLILMLLSGGKLLTFLFFLIACVFYIFLPGDFWRDFLKINRFLPDYILPLDFMLGCGFLVVTYCFCQRLHLGFLLKMIPLAIGVYWLFYRLYNFYKKRKSALQHYCFISVFQGSRKLNFLLLLFLACGLIFVYGWAGAVKDTYPEIAGEILMNQDFLWNVGNAESFLIQFPPQDIRFFDVRLTYHYLTELLCACMSIVTGISCYDILAFYQQPMMLSVLVICLYQFGVFFFGGKKGGLSATSEALIFTFAPFLFGCAGMWKLLPNGLSPFWNSNITHLITNINSQTTAIIFLSVFSALFLQAARQYFHIGIIPFTVILASFVLLCFAKGPVAAIVACAVVLTVLLLLPQKKSGLSGVVLCVCIGGIFALIYFSMFSSGANTSMAVTLTGTISKSWFGNILAYFKNTDYNLYRLSVPCIILMQSLFLLPAAMPLFIRGGFRALKNFFHLDAPVLFCTACALGGVFAYFLFNHPSMSQVYFFLMSIFFLDLLAVDELDFFLQPIANSSKRIKRWLHRAWKALVAFFAIVGFITAVFTYINLGGSGLRQLLRNYDIWEKYPYEAVMKSDDQAAAQWLRDHTDAATCRFATNRIHTGLRKEGISNLYSALSGRQAFMEGFQYAVTNMGVSAPVVTERLDVLDILFSEESTPQQILNVCREWGITHIIYSQQSACCVENCSDTVLAETLECVFSSTDVQIYQLP